MEVIMPAAGFSTRFPGMRPKYTLTDFGGVMMWQRAAERLLEQGHRVNIGVLQHESVTPISDLARQKYGDQIRVIVLNQPTQGPAHTVMEIIDRSGIDVNDAILIKDCDSFFDHQSDDANYVCVSNIADHELLRQLGKKSFVVSNDQGIITNIVEKQVVSHLFCVGGYAFRRAQIFIDSFRNLENFHDHEIFVSHVIEQAMYQGEVFSVKTVQDYVDVGTAEEWWRYKDLGRDTIFCDIDGTIVEAQLPQHRDQPPRALQKNVDRLLELQAQGAEIIFVTGRKSEHDIYTRKLLDDLGFVGCRLISGLPNTRRVLINDYNTANPYPRAVAINIRRDNDNLRDFI